MNLSNPLPGARDADAAPLAAFEVEVIRLGVGAATVLGMPTARAAAAADHDLWAAALLVHEIAANPLWRAGRPRPTAAIATALAAARRLTDAAMRRLSTADLARHGPETIGSQLGSVGSVGNVAHACQRRGG